MSLNYDSYHKNLAGTTIDWLPMDTKELYEKNFSENYDKLKKYGWINNPFTYSFNSHGFRCSEFSKDPSIMFLGCSYTAGIGIPEHNRWTDIVSTNLNFKCANLGIGGSSSDTAFRLCYGWIDKIKPKIVVFNQPIGIRVELVTSTNIDNLGVWSIDDYDSFFKRWSIDDENSKFNNIKNSLAIEYLCQRRNIKFIQLNQHAPGHIVDLARDLSHPGIMSNINFSKKVLKHL